MKNRPKMLVILGIIFVFAIVGTSLMVNSQIQNNNSQNKQQDESPYVKKIRQNQDPIAEYNAPEPIDPKEKYLRQKKNEKFGLSKKIVKPDKLKGFALNENSPEFMITSSYQKPKSAFPLSMSDFVVIGKIVKATAFLTDDKSNIYSEFTLGIDEVLKKPVNSNLQSKNLITLIRQGGKVRIPSGKILYRGSLGYSMPEINKFYLLFLKEDIETETFGIVTAYEFREGVVIPLDGEVNGEVMEIFEEQYKYKGYDVNNFLLSTRQ
jgi:hypothetical protein